MRFDVDPRMSIQGARNRASGAFFEDAILRVCRHYWLSGQAAIDKTPEPMQPIKDLGGGRFVVASNGGGWEHISVSPRNRKRQTCPTWEEMCEIKAMFFAPEECVVQYHPPKSDYVNNYPYCLHLWRPTGGVEIPRPPTVFV